MLAQMSARTTPLGAMSAEPRELREALDRLRATDLRADLGRALRFSLDVLRGRPRPEVVIVSDGVLDPPGQIAERLRRRHTTAPGARAGELVHVVVDDVELLGRPEKLS